MVRTKHLKLVYSKGKAEKSKEAKNTLKNCFLLVTNLKYVFIPKQEKIQALRNIISTMYRDFELSSGICDIPYHIKAENKLNKIIKDNKVDYYYIKLKRFQSYMNSL